MGLFDKRGDRALMPIGWALCLVLGAAIGLAGLLLWLAWTLLGAPAFTREQVELANYLDIVTIVLAVVAGVGGVVALVVAYRRQRTGERAEQREQARLENERIQLSHEQTRLLNERFSIASEQLGSDKPAVQLAGVHAMANLADDWDDHEARQMCIDVLCSYLRMTAATRASPAGHDDATGEEARHSDASAPASQRPQDDRETRHTILRTIAAHLREEGTTVTWSGHDFDLRGITIDLDLDLTGAKFDTGALNLTGARFIDGSVQFRGAQFSGGNVWFGRAQFSRGDVWFDNAAFSGGNVRFDNAAFSGGNVSFSRAQFSGGNVSFGRVQFSGGIIWFGGAGFSGGNVRFGDARFFGGRVLFGDARFSGGRVWFGGARFAGGTVNLSQCSWQVPPIGLPDSAPGLLLPTS